MDHQREIVLDTSVLANEKISHLWPHSWNRPLHSNVSRERLVIARIRVDDGEIACIAVSFREIAKTDPDAILSWRKRHPGFHLEYRRDEKKNECTERELQFAFSRQNLLRCTRGQN